MASPSPAAGAARSTIGKLVQARAKRQTQTSQAVAATVNPKVALARGESAAHKPVVKNFVLPADLIARCDLRKAEFRKETGRGLSWSAIAEVALIELLDRDDFDAVIERHGARARRPDVK